MQWSLLVTTYISVNGIILETSFIASLIRPQGTKSNMLYVLTSVTGKCAPRNQGDHEQKAWYRFTSHRLVIVFNFLIFSETAVLYQPTRFYALFIKRKLVVLGVGVVYINISVSTRCKGDVAHVWGRKHVRAQIFRRHCHVVFVGIRYAPITWLDNTEHYTDKTDRALYTNG